jgi:hypothetical protein
MDMAQEDAIVIHPEEDYEVDVASAALTKRGTVTLPAGVQYAWPHAGIFAHQVRHARQLAILVTRGNEGTPTGAGDPGALKVFD